MRFETKKKIKDALIRFETKKKIKDALVIGVGFAILCTPVLGVVALGLAAYEQQKSKERLLDSLRVSPEEIAEALAQHSRRARSEQIN